MTKVDFLFERPNILSKIQLVKLANKIKRKPTFEDKPSPKLVKNSQRDKGGTINRHTTYPPLRITVRSHNVEIY